MNPDPPPSLEPVAPRTFKLRLLRLVDLKSQSPPKDWPHAPVHRLADSAVYFVTASTLHKAHYFGTPETRDLLAPFDRGSGETPYEVHQALQDCMGRNVGIFRVQEDLERALRELEGLKERAARVRVEGSRIYNPGWHLSRDLRNMLLVSEAIARSASLRKESRGAHSRLDFPNMDASLSKVNMCVTRAADGMNVTPTPLPEMPAELKALFDAAPQPAPQPSGSQA